MDSLTQTQPPLPSFEDRLKELKKDSINKKELQEKIDNMEEDDNIWDILGDDYGLHPGPCRWEDEEVPGEIILVPRKDL